MTSSTFPRRWRKTIDIKPTLDSDELTLAGKAVRLVTLLTGSGIPRSILDDLIDAAATEDEDAVDDVLERIYDWADASRVWLGL